MEDDAYYLSDDKDVDMALGGLNATLRDYAKFGLLYLNNGKWDDEQVVPSSWVDASHNMDAPHLQPGVNDLSSSAWGYGYHQTNNKHHPPCQFFPIYVYVNTLLKAYLLPLLAKNPAFVSQY